MALDPGMVLRSIGDAIGGFMHPTDPRQAAAKQVVSFDQQMKDKGWTKRPDGSYYQGPDSIPQPVVSPVPQSGGFKYQMGKTDYSDVAPQVQTILKGTPLEPYTDDFIKAGNRHKVDPRVLVTVANNESSLGKNYPADSFNPFGYLVNPTTGHGVEDVYVGLRNAGFTSLPHAIDALTGRFARQPSENYKKFYQDPTIENLQTAYNANPAERDTYLKNATALATRFR